MKEKQTSFEENNFTSPNNALRCMYGIIGRLNEPMLCRLIEATTRYSHVFISQLYHLQNNSSLNLICFGLWLRNWAFEVFALLISYDVGTAMKSFIDG